MKRGMTVVELMVAAAIIGIISVLMLTYMTDRVVDNAIKNAQSDLQLDLQNTIDVLSRDVKHSATVDLNNRWPDSYAPNAPGDPFSWQTNSDTLVLAQPVQDANSNVLFEDQLGYVSYKDNHIYFVSNQVFYKRTIAADVANNREVDTCPEGTSGCHPDAILARNVTAFSVGYYDANDQAVPDPTNARSVEVNVTINRRVYNRDLSAQRTIRTVFRNE